MQAELERDLLIRPSPVDERDSGLECLEIQKVEGVLQCIEEPGDRGAVYVGLAVSLGLQLDSLGFGQAESRGDSVLAQDAIPIQRPGLCSDAGQSEDIVLDLCDLLPAQRDQWTLVRGPALGTDVDFRRCREADHPKHVIDLVLDAFRFFFSSFCDILSQEEPSGIDVTLADVRVVDVQYNAAIDAEAGALPAAALEGEVIPIRVFDRGAALHLDDVPGISA